jgi:DNA-binding transcriptional MerR regulator
MSALPVLGRGKELESRESRPWRSIQEVSEQTGLSPHTLRYYEKEGLLSPVERSEGGIRRYDERSIDSLLFVTRLRSTGMPIHKIREYVTLVKAGPSSNEARRVLLEGHRNAVLEQIRDLQQCLAAVDFKIDLYKQGWVAEGADDPCLKQLRKLCMRPRGGEVAPQNLENKQ